MSSNNKGGYKLSEETKIRMSKAKRGMTDKTKEKIGKSRKGKIPANILRGDFTGKNNYLWKGAKVSYSGLHKWVNRHLGKATICEHCGKERITPKSMHWANKSRKYKRDLIDWISLCVPCHKVYDGYKRRINKNIMSDEETKVEVPSEEVTPEVTEVVEEVPSTPAA